MATGRTTTPEPRRYPSWVNTIRPRILRFCTLLNASWKFSIGIVTLTCLRGKSVFQGRMKGGGTSDRAIYYENQACELDWEVPGSRLSPVGLDALKALLEIDPLRRPLAADALMSQWYD